MKLPAVLGSAAKPARAPASGRVSSRQRLPRRDGDGGAAESSSRARIGGRESAEPACGGLPDVPQMVTASVLPGVSPETAEVAVRVFGGRESAIDLGRPGGGGGGSSSSSFQDRAIAEATSRILGSMPMLTTPQSKRARSSPRENIERPSPQVAGDPAGVSPLVSLGASSVPAGVSPQAGGGAGGRESAGCLGAAGRESGGRHPQSDDAPGAVQELRELCVAAEGGCSSARRNGTRSGMTSGRGMWRETISTDAWPPAHSRRSI